MKRDPLPAKVLATRLIPNVSADMAKQLNLKPEHKSLALLTADCDDVTYTALDEATKKADCEVVYAKSFYAGAANANTKLAGEIIGILAAPNPAEAKAGLEAAVDMIENVSTSFLQTRMIPSATMHTAFPEQVLTCLRAAESRKARLSHT